MVAVVPALNRPCAPLWRFLLWAQGSSQPAAALPGLHCGGQKNCFSLPLSTSWSGSVCKYAWGHTCMVWISVLWWQLSGLSYCLWKVQKYLKEEWHRWFFCVCEFSVPLTGVYQWLKEQCHTPEAPTSPLPYAGLDELSDEQFSRSINCVPANGLLPPSVVMMGTCTKPLYRAYWFLYFLLFPFILFFHPTQGSSKLFSALLLEIAHSIPCRSTFSLQMHML